MPRPFPPSTRIAIMGIRGLPAAHGGFESFAERLAPELVRQGAHVTVYCQEDGAGQLSESHWGTVRRIHIPCGPDTPQASIVFDWRCIAHAVKERPDVVLILGYNTAAFAARLRLARIPTVINMDGIEWSRAKWSKPARAWLYLNERLGCLLGNHLVADHPVIADHLATRVTRQKITTIPYGADLLGEVSDAPLAEFNLKPGSFATLIARPEPENSILPIVKAFSQRQRGVELVVLGNYQPQAVPYHAEVMAAASPEVRFVGAIYESATVQALRTYGLFYSHGHQVGGTNPSLLEAMGAGNAVLAHDNPFNKWVLGNCGEFFTDEVSCDLAITRLLENSDARKAMQTRNRQRVAEVFMWQHILDAYARLLGSVVQQPYARHRIVQDNPIWKHHTT